MPHTALIANHELSFVSRGEGHHPSVDLSGRVYEYFLTWFAGAEGKDGGQFYTPSCVVRILVEMLAPYKGRIYDLACGSGGMLVQSGKLVEFHGGKNDDIRIYDQESNATTRHLAIMKLAIRGIEADVGKERPDTFGSVQHPDIRADYILANPPFNNSDTALRGSTALHLANGVMSSGSGGEGEIQPSSCSCG